ncbi:glycoside hydrolase family 43 protein [Mucilaginibacter sp.]|jgi:xylan 1,4-beta-xylosidase|uniref:glycoside hydrolase family 43 protein n=1 Tax=Mucilaginibacter sp. TaxID=1882438 RepID=UPI002617AB84|nr:glycoside hydrolase family 43 protein [Mucilaginibacter sp.]MDB5128869.1 beta-xylosidase [Mucilaginibacter sp.]
MTALLCSAILSYGQSQRVHIPLADPTIFYDEGIYYLYGTGAPDGFPVYTSSDLINWTKKEKNALQMGESYGTKGFWAPQVFKYKGKYFMAYTANEHIAIASSNSPLGPFKQSVQRPVSENGKQIDPFVFKDSDGRLYLYHVRLKDGNRIFVAQINEALDEIDETTATECIHAENGWENTNSATWPVSEGPTVVKRNGFYYLFYSANDFRNIDYSVGYAVASSPAGPWKKYKSNPILSRSITGKNGSGHGDLVKGRNGKLYYVFHTHESNEKVGKRLTAIVQISFTTGDPSTVSTKANSFRYLETDNKLPAKNVD